VGFSTDELVAAISRVVVKRDERIRICRPRPPAEAIPLRGRRYFDTIRRRFGCVIRFLRKRLFFLEIKLTGEKLEYAALVAWLVLVTYIAIGVARPAPVPFSLPTVANAHASHVAKERIERFKAQFKE
jgi:hypothetical protein